MNKLHVLLLTVGTFIITATACKKENALEKDLKTYGLTLDSTGNDTIPHDSLPHDTIPHDSFPWPPHDTIPHDSFPWPPHDTFPRPPYDTFPHDTVWIRS